MNDPLLRKLSLVDKRAKYDKEALLILSDKRLMACLLKEVVPEVKYYSVEEIITFIDGEPRIDEVGLHPSSHSPSRITGNANESKILGEGTTRFDLWFNLDIPGNDGTIRIIINVEAQNNENPGYDIVTRAIYYACRLVSEQFETEFSGANYDGIKKVYSIWVCMPKEDRTNSVDSYSIERKQEYGECFCPTSRYDLLKVVMIRLGKEPTIDKNFFGALSAIFSDTMNVEEKVVACEDNGYPIIESNLRERMNVMSGLGRDLELQAREKAFSEAKEEYLISSINMLRKAVNTPEEAYNIIKSDTHFENVTFEMVKELFETK